MVFRHKREESHDATSRRSRAREWTDKRLRRKAERLSAAEEGLNALRTRLGLTHDENADVGEAQPANVVVHSTASLARSVIYAPDLDGHAEAGEVVWIWAPVNGPNRPPTERALLVVGREQRTDLLTLLISPNDEHDADRNWLSIGTGQWEHTGMPCWVRLDRLIEVPESETRRRGALFPERRFERVATALRRRYNWT